MTDEERVAYFRAEKELALGMVRDIEQGERRFFESVGTDPVVETTIECLDEKRRYVETLADLIRTLERLVAHRP
jgi:hypothetical protein